MDARFAMEVACSLCVQISILIGSTFMIQRWVGDARAACRLWTLCFVLMIGMVSAGVLLPHRRLLDFPVTLSRETLLTLVSWQTNIAIGLGIVWAIGTTVALIRRASLCVALLKFLSTRCEKLDTIATLDRVGVKADDQEELNILSSVEIQGPFCWQLHRPVIVLPAFLIDEDDTTLRHILLHEIEHLRTRHPMQHFLQGVCSTVFWFHPMVGSAARGAELTREFLCDEVAAKTAGKFGAYLGTLAKVAERCGSVSCTQVPKGTLAFGYQKSALIRRSERLVRLAHSGTPTKPYRSLIAIAGLVAIAVSVQQVWIPTNAMASQRSDWSPWPTWTANALHQINVQVRDFERFDNRVQMHELMLRQVTQPRSVRSIELLTTP